MQSTQIKIRKFGIKLKMNDQCVSTNSGIQEVANNCLHFKFLTNGRAKRRFQSSFLFEYIRLILYES